MNSEKHYCPDFLENLLSKLEKYRTIYISRSFDITTIRIGYDEFILQCLPDGGLKVSITMKRDNNYHYDVAIEYIKDWRDMDALGYFIIAMAAGYSLKKLKCF